MADDEPQTPAAPDGAPDSQLVVVLLVVAVMVVLLGIAQPAVMVTGVLLGTTGALLGVRSKRARTVGEERARRWLITSVGVSLLALLAIAVLGFYESWELSIQFSEGATMRQLEARLPSLTLPRRIAQAAALATALIAAAIAVLGYLQERGERGDGLRKLENPGRDSDKA